MKIDNLYENALKTLWLRQVKKDWELANYQYFQNIMISPVFILSDSKNILGQWAGSNKRTLSISEQLIKNYPWEYVREVIYHEMAHQYVEEVLLIKDAFPHGEAFRKICAKHSFDHTAAGDLKAWAEKKGNLNVDDAENKIINKIHKLFALAQSPNQNEAEMAMAKAQDLLLKHNISLQENNESQKYIQKQIGEVGRLNPIKKMISSILSKFFFVKTIWVFGYNQHTNKTGNILEIYGTHQNIEMAEYVHDYLHNVSEVLWQEYRQKEHVTGNKYRRAFIYGLLDGFYKKLNVMSEKNNSGALIWKGDPLLQAYYKRRNPRVKTLKTYRSQNGKEAYNKGVSKGNKLVINKGIHGRGSGEMRFLT